MKNIRITPNTTPILSMDNKLIVKMLHLSWIALLALPALAAPEDFPDGIEFGDPDIYLKPGLAGELSLTNGLGSIYQWSDTTETSRYDYQGGLHLLGDPVRIYLGTTTQTDGTFEVVPYGDALYAPSNPALFSIDSSADTATFNGLDVSINNGTLSVGGSTVLSQSNATGYLSGEGFLQLSGFNSALSAATPPTSTAWQAAYVTRGSVSNGAFLAMGGTATASGQYSIASGDTAIASSLHSYANGSNVSASASYARATGYFATASANWATAHGNSANATGFYSTANGWGASARTVDETVFGRYNRESGFVSGLLYNPLDGLFRLGNGTNASTRSDAMTVLKNGQTTLTNKEWKAAVTADPADALEDPASTTDSGGEALVVDGHTTLNGKVIISVPQGDISMGIYGN